MMNLGLFYSFLIIETVARTPWAAGQPHRKVATYTGQHKCSIKANIHASSGIWIHDPIVFERAKAVHALDRAATVFAFTMKNSS
jgi:hypothetical protein